MRGLGLAWGHRPSVGRAGPATQGWQPLWLGFSASHVPVAQTATCSSPVWTCTAGISGSHGCSDRSSSKSRSSCCTAAMGRMQPPLTTSPCPSTTSHLHHCHPALPDRPHSTRNRLHSSAAPRTPDSRTFPPAPCVSASAASAASPPAASPLGTSPSPSVSTLETSTSSPSTPSPSPPVLVLGIESSCDDTGVAVVASDGRVLGEALASQADITAQWGGVVPSLARDAHAAAIDRTVEAALAAAGVGPQQLAAVAVTVGPGLSLCLRVGAAKARQIARQYGKPLVAVHHMEAHALVARLPPAASAAAPPAVAVRPQLDEQRVSQGAAGGSGSGASASASESPVALPPAASPAHQSKAPGTEGAHCSSVGRSKREEAAAAGEQGQGQGQGDGVQVDAAAVLADVGAAAAVPFPFLCLLVSGGHNLLVLVRGVGSYVQLGTTLDDALGEAYDKVARLLGLELRPHGGAALEALAKEGDPAAFKLAVPMRKYGTCDFSFAGLKTSTRMIIEQRLRPEDVEAMDAQQLRKLKADIAASFQAVAVTHLAEKSRRGVAWARELAPGLRHLVVAGGVACNRVVRAALEELAASEGLELVLPPPRWCTDNGVMVAWAGVERLACGWAEPPPPPPPLSTPAPEGQAPGSSSSSSSSSASEGAQGTGGVGEGAGGAAEEQEEWIELKPRWPLTGELHPRSAAAAAKEGERRSAKKVRLHTPLSDLAPPVVAAAPPAAAVAPPAAVQQQQREQVLQG